MGFYLIHKGSQVFSARECSRNQCVPDDVSRPHRVQFCHTSISVVFYLFYLTNHIVLIST